MNKLIRDLFQTRQPDGTYMVDMTNPAFSAIPWILGILVYIGLGIYHAITAQATFSLMEYATGFAALFSGGGLGVLLHSKSQV